MKKKRRARKWTPEQDQYIISSYGRKTYKEIAEVLNKTVSSVTHRTYQLGIQFKKTIKPIKWSEDKLEIIKVFIKNGKSHKYIAEYFNCSESAIHSICYDHHITNKKRPPLRHGMQNTRLYHIWNGLKDRCLNPNSPNYKDYGGRGITVDEELLNFQTFYNWAITHGYEDHLTLDRIDVNGNYSFSNLRFVTAKVQQNNRRNHRMISAFGEIKNITQWTEDSRCKVGRVTLSDRLKAGWDTEKAIITPARPLTKRKSHV